MPTLPIGHPCIWYRQGNTQTLPSAALVTGTSPDGILHLIVWPKNSREPLLVRGARHASDSLLEENKQLAIEHGCWDFVDLHIPQDEIITTDEPAAPPAPQSETNGQGLPEPDEVLVEKVLEMHAKKRTVGQISMTLRVPKQVVSQIIETRVPANLSSTQ